MSNTTKNAMQCIDDNNDDKDDDDSRQVSDGDSRWVTLEKSSIGGRI